MSGIFFKYTEYKKKGHCARLGKKKTLSEIMILAVCFQLKQLKKQPDKKFRLEQDSNL